QISTITLGTRNQARAVDFYTKLLQRDADTDRSGVAYFKLQGSWLALYPRADLAAYCGVDTHAKDTSDAQFRAVTVSVNVASTAQVDATVARAKRAGARVVQAAGTASWGGYVAWIADPDEHLWEFVFNPKRVSDHR
ncbi:MAG: catechol 2,3-dioxygenase-like lactoylglutathione lyase family enzyme, partial [Gammaproteobacteria bacterium]